MSCNSRVLPIFILAFFILFACQTIEKKSQATIEKENKKLGMGLGALLSSTGVNKNNVSNLELACQYNSNDGKKGIQANPVVYDGLIYLPTPGNHIVCLDGKNGKEIWRYKGHHFKIAKRGLISSDVIVSVSPFTRDFDEALGDEITETFLSIDE